MYRATVVATMLTVAYAFTHAFGTHSRREYVTASDIPVVGKLLTRLSPHGALYAHTFTDHYAFNATVWGKCKRESLMTFVIDLSLGVMSNGGAALNSQLDQIPFDYRGDSMFGPDDPFFYGRVYTNGGHSTGIQGAYSQNTESFLIIFVK